MVFVSDDAAVTNIRILVGVERQSEKMLKATPGRHIFLMRRFSNVCVCGTNVLMKQQTGGATKRSEVWKYFAHVDNKVG